MTGKTIHMRLDEATDAHLKALTKNENGNRSDAIREAIALASRTASEAQMAPLSERLMRATFAIQEQLLRLSTEIQGLASQVSEVRKHHAERFDQVIAFIKESEKGFGRISDDLKAVNQNSLLAAIYLMGITSTHPRREEIEDFVRRQGGA